MLDAPLRTILKRLLLPLDLRPLPPIAAREHALLERRRIREAANVAGLAIAIIQRSLWESRHRARMPARPDKMSGKNSLTLLRIRRSGCCEAKGIRITIARVATRDSFAV